MIKYITEEIKYAFVQKICLACLCVQRRHHDKQSRKEKQQLLYIYKNKSPNHVQIHIRDIHDIRIHRIQLFIGIHDILRKKLGEQAGISCIPFSAGSFLLKSAGRKPARIKTVYIANKEYMGKQIWFLITNQ